MILAIDLDEVLAEFVRAFLDFHNAKYGTKFKREDITSYNFYEIFKEGKSETMRKIYELYNTRYFKNMPLVPFSKFGINNLSKKHELFIVTSRPRMLSDKTFKWLDKHFGKKFSGVYFSGKPFSSDREKSKAEICNQLGARVIIEDNLTYAVECALSGLNVLLFDCPWNKFDSIILEKDVRKRIRRVFSWKEIVDIFKNEM